MSFELVAIDSRLKDSNYVKSQLSQGYTVLLLNETQDGLTQIVDFLLQQANSGLTASFSALHIVSHGATGEIQLGSTVLNSATLEQHQGDLVEMAKLLAVGADLMVYGCNVAQGTDGQAFVTQLAKLSGLDIAASTGLTGSMAVQGELESANWVLETSVGNLQATALQLNLSENLANNAATGTVEIKGTATQGQVLTATNTLADIDGMGTGASAVPISYQWSAGGVAITGATAATYTLTQAEVGKAITVAASFTDKLGGKESKASAATAAVANVNDAATGTVEITGTATQGQVLTATNTLADIDGMGTGASAVPISYQWYAGGTAITGATGSTLTLGQAQVGKAITVAASFTDKLGGKESKASAATAAVANVNDAATGTVEITGSAIQNQTLTASNTLADIDGLGTLSYQWFAGTTAITGATGQTLTLTQAEVGKAIKVVVSYTDGFDAKEAIGSNVTTLVTSNALHTGNLTIGGTRSQGQTLRAISTLGDADGMGVLSYQWYANGVALIGANTATHKLTQSDVSKTMSVSASYTDAKGAKETITSSATTAIANVNDLATGTVTITGTAIQNQTLTATNTLADIDGLGTVSYQWLAGGVAIAGATGSTLTLGQAQVGKAITVAASFTDELGGKESKASAATMAVANFNDVATGEVVISGTPTQGQTLSAVNTVADLDGLGTVRYQWLSDGVAIAGANLSTYKLTQTDVNKSITLNASYTDGFGLKESITSAATNKVANFNDVVTGTITIAGKPTQGQTLTASHTLADIDGMGTVSYQWLANGVAITGATTATHTLSQAQVNKVITVSASFLDALGTLESKTSVATTAVVNVNDFATGEVAISGTATQGQVLTATNTLADLDGMGTVSYQWLANGVAIAGATTGSYKLLQSDVNKTITVKASYTDVLGAKEVVTSSASSPVANFNDGVTGTVSISGTATQNQTLKASNTLGDLDGLGAVRYQWLAGGEAITGATAATYKLTQAEVGKSISVKASYTDGFGAQEFKTSVATSAVVNVNDLATGKVTITGTPIQNQTLTATNTLADLDGMGVVSYQWRAGGVAIAGATSSTFTLTQAEVNKAVTVIASYTDRLGTKEFVTSAATTAVVNVNDQPTGGVTVTGLAAQGQTLTVHSTLADLDGLGTVSYQWLADGVAITGNTATTYVLGQGDVGKSFSVKASYTDGFGAKEVVTSGSTVAVANVNDAPTGGVTLTGTATQGEILTAASNTLADLDGMGTVSYQWFADGEVIQGAEQSTYTLTQAEVGKSVKVVASYVDGFGTKEAVTSAATAAVANVNDLPTGGVTIEGTPKQYETLTVSNTLQDLDGMGEVSYQWRANGVDIEGATGEHYQLAQSDVGKTFSVTALYTDGFLAQESVTSSETSAVANVNDGPTGGVTIEGTPEQYQTLTVSNNLDDIDGMGEVSYQWFADGLALDGAVGKSYELTQADVGKSFTVTASYVDGFEAKEAVTSAATAAVANVNDLSTGSVTISGTSAQGETLTVSNTLDDIDGMGPVSYQWFADGLALDGAVGESYELTQAEVGKVFTVTASYNDGFGANEAATSAETSAVENINDVATGEVVISGTAAQGETLTVNQNIEDIDGMGEIHYQWLLDGVAIEGAEGESYQLSQGDVGKTLTVVASYTDAFGAPEQISSTQTDAVANVNDDALGEVTINGLARQGETLSASHNLEDKDGMGLVGYQWYADGVALDGATADTYQLSQQDVGKSLSVSASYTDGFGQIELVSSFETMQVENVNDQVIGQVTVLGTPTQGESLMASHDLQDLDGMGEVRYQWSANGVEIAGASGESYELGQDDVGKVFAVTVSFTDEFGEEESQTSGETTPVANVNDEVYGEVSISGTPIQGETLTASHNLEDLDGMGEVRYQWFADGEEIAGANSDSYQLGQDDVGKSFTVSAIYTDGFDASESLSSQPTDVVANVNDLSTGSVTISGTMVPGETLVATHNLADKDGMEGAVINYQWYADGVAIDGAMGDSYLLGAGDVGHTLVVMASYTDELGSEEVLQSEPSEAVAYVNHLPTGSLTISGTPDLGEVMTVTSQLEDEDGMGELSYRWFSNGVAIEGAVGEQFQMTAAELGTALSVAASYTDGMGTLERVGSDDSITSLAITSGSVADAVNENIPAGTLIYTTTSTQAGVVFQLNQTSAAVGAALTVTQTASQVMVDTLAEGVTLARNKTGPIYSNQINGVDTVQWNSDGWAQLDNVSGRTYTSFANALNNKVGDYILPAELVMHDTVHDTYYKVDFTQYQGGGSGGAFSYQRSQIVVSEENNFEINDQGQVFLTGSPDYEAQSAYQFKVIATDEQGHTAQKTVSLAINNLDDHAPEITSGNTARTLVVDTGPNQLIYTVTSDDSGDISSGPVTYSLAAPRQTVLGDEVAVSLPSKSFYRGMDYTDVIAPGVGFSRGLIHEGFAVTAEWNTDGWGGDLDQVAQRAYDIRVPYNQDTAVMHDIFEDRYYGFFFDTQGGRYVRMEIMADGGMTNSVDVSLETLRTTGDIISAGLKLQVSVDSTSGINGLYVAPTVEWNDGGWNDLSDLSDVRTRVFDAEVNGNTATNTNWVMHDTVNDTYYTVDFSKWSMGSVAKDAVGGGGGFAYERQQIDLSGEAPVLGEAVAVYAPDGMHAPVDVFDSGVELTRFWAMPLQGVQTVEWNADGWGDDLTDVAARNYTTNMALAVMLDPDNYDNLGEVVLDRQWLMHDLVHDTYYQIEFQGWQQDGGGSFAYTRSQINTTTGALFNTVEFTKSAETPFDLVDDGVVISRGMQRPLNSSGVEWNGDGWSNLEDVASRDFYTHINDVRNDDWTDSQFVMHDLLSDRYYKIEIANWEQEGGGAVSYVRSEIIQQLGETGLAVGDFAIDPDTGEVRLLVDPLPENSPYNLIVVATDAAGNISSKDVELVVQPNYAPAFELVNPDTSGSSGLVAYWKMDEGTGTVALDSGPNHLNANLAQNASWANSGAPGFGADKSVRLDHGYLQVADSQLFNLSSGFTISAWANPTDGFNNTIMDRANYNFLFQIGANGQPGLCIYNDRTGWLNSTTPIDVGAWVHVAASWDPGSNTIKLYKDGVLTDTFANLQALHFNAGELNIGRQSPNADRGNEMDGQLDEVAIYDHALSQSQISSLMQAGVPQGDAVAFADHGDGVAYQAAATDANAGTVLTYGLLDSLDAAFFTIDATTGAVRFIVAPDMAQPQDAGGDNIYNLTVTASDGVNKPTELAVSIEVLVPPSISPTASANFDENATGVVYAAQAAGSHLTYTLAGTDAALFAIDAGTGALRFVNTPNFENPLDAGQNNVYDVAVVASTYNLQASQQVSVAVGNVYEAPVMVAGDTWSTSFDEGALTSKLHIDVPEPNRASVVLDAENQQLDFFALDPNGLDMYYGRNGAPIVWADSPVVQLGQSWSVQTQVHINDGFYDYEQIAGIVFYDADGGVPNFYFALTEWLQGGQASVATQSCGGNGISGQTYTLLAPETSDVYLKVQVTERGLTDDYQFFYKNLLADSWVAVGDAGTYTSEGNDSRVGLVYKTRRDAAGVSFDDFAITAPVSVAENTTGTVYTANATAEAGSTLSYALGGTDAALFSINKDTGAVAFLAAPNYEDPRDAGGSNLYDLTVTASDGIATSAPQSVVIGVSNVVERSAVNVTVSPAQVPEGDAANLVYTFTRSGDIGDALTVNIGMGGAATGSDFATSLPPLRAWTRLAGGAAYDLGESVTTAADGSVYVAGSSDSNGFVNKYDAEGLLQWTRTLDGTEYVTVKSVVTAADGSVYLSGSTFGPINFGPGNTLESPGGSDGFVVKYAQSGELLWTRWVGGAGSDEAFSIATAADGSVYVTGSTSGSIDNETNNGANDVFITKLDSDGSTQWTRLLGGSNQWGATYDYGYSVSTSTDGSVYVAGHTGGSIDGEESNGSFDGFVTKYDAQGALQWARLMGSPNNDYVSSVATDANGAVYLAGYVHESIDGQAHHGGGADGFVTKYDANGIRQWTRLNGGAGYDVAKTVATAVDGSVYVTGYTNGSIDGQASNNGSDDSFVTKYNADGAKQWTVLSGGQGYDAAYSVATGAGGAFYVAGIAAGPALHGITTLGDGDAFITKFVANTTQITFNAGSSTATLAVQATADQLTEANETVTVTVLAGQGYDVGTNLTATGTIEDNLTPVIASADSANVEENTTDTVYTASATDANVGSTLTYALSGTDATRFTIDASTGAVAFANAPDFETPLDDGSDNVYDINVTASDGVNTSAAQAVAITVSDVLASVNVTVAPAQVLEGDQTDLVYTFTRSGDTSGALTVNLGVGGTATADDYTPNLALSASGLPTVQWTRLAGGAGDDIGWSVATGADGSVYIAGFTNSGAPDGQISNGADDGFVTKYTTDGTKAWTRLAVGAGQELGFSVATDADGSVYIAGYTDSGSLDGQTSNGADDGFVTKYTTDGTKAWTRLAGGAGHDIGFSVATGADGSVYIAGSTTSGSIDGQASNGGYDGFVTKYTADGTKAWTRLAGGAGDDIGLSVATCADGSVYIAGYTNSGSIDGQTSNGGDDGFVTKYTADGTKAWTRLAGGAGQDFGQSVATDADGSVYIAGSTTSGSIDGQTSNGGGDGFVTKYTADGTKAWTRLAGGAGQDFGQSVATGADGSVFIAGYTFGGSLDGQTSNGGYDGFVTKFSSQLDQTQITFAASSSTAALTVRATADQVTEAPETLTVSVLAGDGYTLGSTSVATGTIEDNAPPVISSADSVSVEENTTGTVYTASATDTNVGSTLTYALGGTDATRFTIDANTGAVAFANAPDFEAPADADGDNVYNINVTASDGVNTSAAQAVAITVSDVNDTTVMPSMIDLGTVSGLRLNLIAPWTASDGSVYYFVDASGDGKAWDFMGADEDVISHIELDEFFNNGQDTTDVISTRTRDVGEYRLTLPSLIEWSDMYADALFQYPPTGWQTHNYWTSTMVNSSTHVIHTADDVWGVDAVGNVSFEYSDADTSFVVLRVEPTVNPPSLAGQDVIDLSSYGQLIAPVQVEGKWYYHWDRNDDGTTAGDTYTRDGDTYQLSEIYNLFKQDINGNTGSATDDTYRYAVINGVELALPELGAGISANLDGTIVDNTQSTNSTYDGLAAIWDAHNGSQEGTYLNQGLDSSTTSSNGYESGVPSGWVNDTYVSATPQDGEYAFLRIYDGLSGPHANWGMNVALQVL